MHGTHVSCNLGKCVGDMGMREEVDVGEEGALKEEED